LEVHEQLWPLEVARGHADIVLLSRMVKLRETPVDESQLAGQVLRKMEKKQNKNKGYLFGLVVNHNVVWLDVAVHDSPGVAKVEGLDDLADVIADVLVAESRVEDLEVGVVDVLKHKRGYLGLYIVRKHTLTISVISKPSVFISLPEDRARRRAAG